MKIKLSEQNTNNKNNKPQFKGIGLSCGLHFLNNYPAIGALCIDAGSMGIPRTTIDSFRGKDAAKETAIREFGSTINFSFIGLWCALSSTLCGKLFNRKYPEVRAEKIFANNLTIDLMSKLYNTNPTSDKTENAKNFAKEFCKSIQTLNGNKWQKLPQKSEETAKIEKALADAIKENRFDSKFDKVMKNKITTMIMAETGSGQNARLVFANKSVNNLSVADCVEHFISLGKSFVHTTKGKLNAEFINDLKRNKMTASLAGIAIPLSIALSVQPINRYLTKRRTGQEGFVGVKGGHADNSKYFKYEKLGAAVLFSTATLATIGKNMFNKIQFSSFVPNLSQFKLIYGLTIGSRLLVARDKNELRETCIKDTLGYANWLIVGGFVSKLVARWLNKDIINYDASTLKKNAGCIAKSWHWITNASIKSSEEVLVNSMKNSGFKIFKDGKAKSFKELLKELPEQLKSTRGKISAINKAQVSGYIYSMLALGCGVTIFNMLMTNYFVKKHNKSEQEYKGNKENIKDMKDMLQFNKQPLPSNTEPVNLYFMSDKVMKKIQKEN